MKFLVKLKIKPQKAKPNSNISSALGPKGINIIEFCKKFNTVTSKLKTKDLIPVFVYIKNKKYKIVLKTPYVSYYIKKFANNKKTINKSILKKIFLLKRTSFNTLCKKKVFKIILGTARSMGFDYE
ncbi:uL11 family ribosomal protein [Candidatus Vidania fulgoroideorum]